jgi:hypothetical protein
MNKENKTVQKMPQKDVFGKQEEKYLRIIEATTAYVHGPKPFLNRYYEIIHSGKFYVPAPKPVLKPVESSIHDAVYKMVGKKDTYKVINIKDVQPELIEERNYDGALYRVLPGVNGILHTFFKKHLNPEEQKGVSSGTTSKVPKFRKFELEIFDEHNELQYFLIYGRGKLIDSSASLESERFIAVLKNEAAWEA